MQYKKFILSLTDDGLQEAELNRFLRGHRAIKVEQHFMPDEALWAFLVCYMDGEQKETAPGAHRSNSERFDPSKELTPEQLARYKHYAYIRLQLARRDNVKAFVVFTNRELAAIAKVEELSVDVLKGIDGIGEARIEQYGEDFVRMAIETIKEHDGHETGGPFDGEDSAA